MAKNKDNNNRRGLLGRLIDGKRYDPCADHCPQELEHKVFFARGLPTPCGCTPVNK